MADLTNGADERKREALKQLHAIENEMGEYWAERIEAGEKERERLEREGKPYPPIDPGIEAELDAAEKLVAGFTQRRAEAIRKHDEEHGNSMTGMAGQASTPIADQKCARWWQAVAQRAVQRGQRGLPIDVYAAANNFPARGAADTPDGTQKALADALTAMVRERVRGDGMRRALWWAVAWGAVMTVAAVALIATR